jgi:rhodanese-related sulfurtransferase
MTASTTFEQLYLDTPSVVAASTRISARAAFQSVLANAAVLIDIRPARQRLAQGGVHPGLEPLTLSAGELTGLEGEVILICADGHASGPAAEVLRRLGLASARAVDGGYAAWRAAGMPIS